MEKNYRSWPDQWPKSLNYPELPVYECLNQTAARVPDRLAIIFGGMELTYAELKDLADRFATALASLGVKKGDRVAIHLPNSPQFAIAYYGLLKAGAVFTPLSPLSSPKEAEHQLKDSGAETLISLDFLFPGISDVLAKTPVKRIITTSIADCYNSIIAPLKPLTKIEVANTIDMTSLLKDYEPDLPDISINVTNDLAHLAYTGGTTGTSKGVMLTHFNVMTNSLQFACWLTGAQIDMKDRTLTFFFPPGVDPKRDRIAAPDRDSVLIVVPWFHAMGSVGYLNSQVIAGNTMVVYPRFDPKEYIGGVAKYKASAMGGAPQLFIPLINLPDFDSYDLSGVKVALSGAAPLAITVLEKLLDSLSGVVIEAYGLTECTMGAMANPPDRASIRPGSVGLPVFDTECRIVDVITGDSLEPGKEGELCIRGPQVMKGYWNKPEETERVLKGGWLYTGDVARQDEDGFFYITDRIKDMIIYKGYNVYPREIEEIIFKHPAVEQCAVVGKPDAEGGEIPIAFVQLKQGELANEEAILNHANSGIAHYKKIRKVLFLDQLPVSAAGKVLKKELRSRVMQHFD